MSTLILMMLENDDLFGSLQINAAYLKYLFAQKSAIWIYFDSVEFKNCYLF